MEGYFTNHKKTNTASMRCWYPSCFEIDLKGYRNKHGLSRYKKLFNYIYPKENEALYNRIIENGGLIISEYPNSVAPTPDKFCFRNRIVADIGSFLVIGEAYERSGTSITVNYALNAGKGIGCVPYPANVNSACNALIKDGAAMIENSDDLLLQLGRNIINDTKSKKAE